MIISMTVAKKMDDVTDDNEILFELIAKKTDDTNDANDDYTHLFEPVTKQQLRGLSVAIKSLEAFRKIHERVITIAVNGGSEHKYKLCFKNHNITNTIDELMHEKFPDSTIESKLVGNCTVYKINW